MSENFKYVCVHCGERNEKIYREFKNNLIKLLKCNNCNQIVDKYIGTKTSLKRCSIFFVRMGLDKSPDWYLRNFFVKRNFHREKSFDVRCIIAQINCVSASSFQPIAS